MTDHHGNSPSRRSPEDERYEDVYDQHREYDHEPGLAGDMLPDGEDPGDAHPQRRRASPVRRWVSLALAAAVVVVGGVIAFNVVQPLLGGISLSGGSQEIEDYEGQGTGEVSVTIPEGATGGQIGQILEEADVVASAQAFADIAAADPRASGLQPGTYLLRGQMSAASAFEMLLDPESRQVQRVTVREGLWASEIYQLLAEATGSSVEDYRNIDPATLGLPPAAQGEVEGYLFPATYDFEPGTEPGEQLTQMVDRAEAELERLGVPQDEVERTMIIASIVEGEGRLPEDLPKVARVIENRLQEGMPLQMDSTVHYIHQERGRAGTTDEQRAEDDPYNTYVYPGLPPGPINNPGAAAIQAAADPAEGDWLYFVAVDPETGQTEFAETYEEHLQNQEQFQQWCRDNPDQC